VKPGASVPEVLGRDLMKCVRAIAPRTEGRSRARSNVSGAGVEPTIRRAQAACRASTVRRPNSAAVRLRSRTCGATPVSSATVRSSMATAVRVKAASVSVASPKSKNGLASALLPSTLLMMRTWARSWAPSVRAHSRLAAAMRPIVPISSACV
jgi:hypothetical protein